jgi:hypothetical protein
MLFLLSERKECLSESEQQGYSDFYDSRNPELKGNTLDWPKFPHHKSPDKTKPLCIQYQAAGQCNAKCFMSHVDPSKVDAAVKATFNAIFASIYS